MKKYIQINIFITIVKVIGIKQPVDKKFYAFLAYEQNWAYSPGFTIYSGGHPNRT